MITNHTSQITAVRLAMAGLHRNFSALSRFTFGVCVTGATALSGTGGSGAPVACSTRRSRSATTASASSVRPCWSRKRGDSGSERRHHSSMTIGSAVITCAIRQPSSNVGTTNRPISAAITNPNEKKPASAPMNQPRRLAGTNSDRNGAMIALSAPAPAPASTREPRKIS